MLSDEDKLKQVCALTGAGQEADGGLIAAYLSAARSLILETRNPFADDPDSVAWEPRYDSLQCLMAADMYNWRGADNEIAHVENGITRTRSNAGVSKQLLQRIVPRCKSRSVK